MRSPKHNFRGDVNHTTSQGFGISGPTPFAESPVRFESLEARQMMSVSSPTPGDGNDYTFVDDATDAGAPAMTASIEQFRRIPMAGGFKWYDATAGRLTNAAPGVFQPIALDSYMIWPPDPILGGVNKTGPTSEAGTRALARQAVAQGVSVVVIDIEEWNLDVRSGSRATVDSAVARFRQVLGWIRDERPQLKVGIYGYLSISDSNSSSDLQRFQLLAAAGSQWHAASIPLASAYYADWQVASDYLGTLAQDCDYVFPSIYTGSTDINDWVNYAKAMITDSRRFGKPVIPFIWPQYHNSVQGVGLQFLSQPMWQTELDLVHDMADSAVIWVNPNTLTAGSDAWIYQTVAKAQQDVGGPGASPSVDDSTPGASSEDDGASSDSISDFVTDSMRRRMVDQVLGSDHVIV